MLTLTPANRLRVRQSAHHVMRTQPAATHVFSDTMDMMGAASCCATARLSTI